MGWDLRKGEGYPTIIRKVFEVMEDGERRTRKEVETEIAEEVGAMGINLNPTSLGTILRNMGTEGYLDVEKGSRYMAPNHYSITEEGWRWWQAHQEEGWGYGKKWDTEKGTDEFLEDGEGKLMTRLRESKAGKVRVSMPCDKDVWREISALARQGRVSLIVCLEQDG